MEELSEALAQYRQKSQEDIVLPAMADATQSEVTVAMSNSFGFGGCNTSLLFGRGDATAERACPAPARVFVSGVGVVAPPVVDGSPVDSGGSALWARPPTSVVCG